uniref:Uncharacterized protein n=1 Tax=viral metagenome TaxID=1070528 RepID=A0A6C0CSY7_9ZZZZ
MEVMILLAIMCCVLLLLIMITQLHKKELKECFNEQARFSKKLLDLEEQEDEEVEIDEQEPIYKTTTSCQCEIPDRTVFKVDEIKPDKTNKAQFLDDVQMNRAEVSGTLTINETPFATFDATNNKLIIG